jgi:hypothetical protein
MTIKEFLNKDRTKRFMQMVVTLFILAFKIGLGYWMIVYFIPLLIDVCINIAGPMGGLPK